MRIDNALGTPPILEPRAHGDIEWWTLDGVPGGSLDNANGKYFYFHHTNGDTMTVEDPDTLDLCAAVWAISFRDKLDENRQRVRNPSHSRAQSSW